MKGFIKLFLFSIVMMAMASCSQGASAIDKAYEQACGAASPEEVATTLCNGDIKVPTLTSEEYAKLGAVIEYLTYTGMYSSNFEAQVDMYQFGNLLRDYRAHTQTPSERLQIDELTKDILLNTQGTLNSKH